MRLLNFATAMALLALAVRVSDAQSIPLTVAAAQAEGAAFPHAAPPTESQSFFGRPFGGTSARMCTPSLPNDSLPGGSLRSGEIIIRSSLAGRWGPHAGRGHKILWMPLHGPADTSTRMSFAEWRKKAIGHAPLLIRAVRLGLSSDSMRQTLANLTGGPRQFGFPSEVTFPTAGQWLVLASTDEDWGCFLLDVASP
jgi:hypothetical protein